MGTAEQWVSNVQFTGDGREVTGDYDGGEKFALEYLTIYDGAYIKLVRQDGTHTHVIIPVSIVERFVDGVRSYRDPQPEPVKLTPRQQFDALPNLAKFRFDNMTSSGHPHYEKLNEEYVQLVSDFDGFRYDPETFDSVHGDRDLEEIL